MNILHIRVGDPMAATLDRAKATMQALELGESPSPSFGIGFESLPQFFAVCTPRRRPSGVRAMGRDRPAAAVDPASRMEPARGGLRGDAGFAQTPSTAASTGSSGSRDHSFQDPK